MKKRLLFVLLSVLVPSAFMNPASAQAQTCQMYTYSDLSLDGSGNVVAINYTDGDAACGSYSAYADVTLTMPSGYAQSASASGGCCAQAVALAVSSNENGDGTVFGNNNVEASCFSFTSFLSNYFRLARTTFHWTGGNQGCYQNGNLGNMVCDWNVESWCTPETTPPLANASVVTDSATPDPLGYWKTLALCVRIGSSYPWTCDPFKFSLQVPPLPREACTTAN